MYYETLNHTGKYPIVGVNTFLNKKGSPTIIPEEVIRSTTEEKELQITNLNAFQKRHEGKSAAALKRLQETAIGNGNLFAELMETVKCCSLGRIYPCPVRSRRAVQEEYVVELKGLFLWGAFQIFADHYLALRLS